MNLEQRLQAIKQKLEKISVGYTTVKAEQETALAENISLKQELEALKTTNFELTKKIEIAEMADQLLNEDGGNDELRAKLDKYIREVDAVVKALKKL